MRFRFLLGANKALLACTSSYSVSREEDRKRARVRVGEVHRERESRSASRRRRRGRGGGEREWGQHATQSPHQKRTSTKKLCVNNKKSEWQARTRWRVRVGGGGRRLLTTIDQTRRGCGGEQRDELDLPLTRQEADGRYPCQRPATGNQLNGLGSHAKCESYANTAGVAKGRPVQEYRSYPPHPAITRPLARRRSNRYIKVLFVNEYE
ncbi:hypothetical protein J6590_063669 [Homalodisca vitripennis]|nr:hypothetical protein J6590_063669 [Homalodisca vitripennis]